MISSKWLNKTNNDYKVHTTIPLLADPCIGQALPDTEDPVINHTESCSDARYYVDIMIDSELNFQNTQFWFNAVFFFYK